MTRSSLKVGTAAAASILYALPALAQSGPATTRDGAVEQAIQNTIAANLKRRGYAESDPIMASTKTAVSNAINQATTSGCAITGICNTANRSWAETLRGLLSDALSGFTWPLSIGKQGEDPPTFAGGGTFGGGGADGTWGDPDCGDIKADFDAGGFLIIPSYSLKVGLPLTFGPNGGPVNMFASATGARAKSAEATARWVVHLKNATRIPQEHFGIVGVTSDASYTYVDTATVGYRNASNVYVGRVTSQIIIYGTYLANVAPHGSPAVTDIECPAGGATGGEFQFYGNSGSYSGPHSHSCTAYAPNPELGEGGYFVNPKTTVRFRGTEFPDLMAPGLRACLLDQNFIKRLSDAIFKKTSGGAPYAPIQNEDVRDNNLPTVQDLDDEPTTGTRPDPNPVDVGTPPPPPTPPATPPPPPPPSGVDLGPDPGIGTPGDPEAPTNILDPVFDWLPDLPSIQLNVAGAQCPTWEMQPFPGPEWNLVMDKHCPFISDNAALISTIMILGFTIGSAMIILRA